MPELFPKHRSNTATLPRDIYIGLVTDLFGNAFTVGLITAVLAVVGGYLAISLANPWIGAAVALGVIVGTIRFVTANRRYRQIKANGATVEEARRWESRFAILTYAFAASLGVTAALVFLGDDATAELLILAVLFAYGAGVAARLALRPKIANGAMIIVAALTVPAIASAMTWPYLLLAAAFVAFLIGGLVTVRNSYDALIEQLVTRNEFARLARYDHLTGLPNRLLLREELDRALAASRGSKRSLALHHVDLDRFKSVNDSYGHLVGDELLKQFGQRLTGVLQPGDVAARLGGDEFVVLQLGAPSWEEIEGRARRIVDAAQTPFDIGGRSITIGASIGVAMAPLHGSELAELIRCADVALYEIKGTGRDGFATYAAKAGDHRIAS